RRLLQPPVVTEQQVEVAVVPFGRVRGPGAFDAAGDGVAADATGGVVLPAEALFFQFRAFRSRAEGGGVAVAVTCAYGMGSGGERHGFLVLHRHAGEGDAYVMRSLDRIRLAIDAFRVDVDQAHHDGGKR